MMIPNKFFGEERRVVHAYSSFGTKLTFRSSWFLELLIARMREHPEDFGSWQDLAAFVAEKIEDVSGLFILLKEDADPESIREMFIVLSQEFWGIALFPEQHCFEAAVLKEALPKEAVAA